MTPKRVVNKGEIENVRVFVRVRPLNKKEKAEKHRNIIQIDEEENVLMIKKPISENEKPKLFKFDHIFNEECTQVCSKNA